MIKSPCLRQTSYINSPPMPPPPLWSQYIDKCIMFLTTSLVQTLVSHVWFYIHNNDFHTHLYISHGFITKLHQLPVGFLAQLVKNCTRIAEVMASDSKPWIFLRHHFINLLNFTGSQTDKRLIKALIKFCDRLSALRHHMCKDLSLKFPKHWIQRCTFTINNTNLFIQKGWFENHI